jgi:NAD(P)H-dependent flavin oxidoreductase YrpB (nitropropane dioxygenase family)
MDRPGMGFATGSDQSTRKTQCSAQVRRTEEGPLSMGQDAGLIHDIPSAAEIVTRIAQEAEEILTRKMPRLISRN